MDATVIASVTSVIAIFAIVAAIHFFREYKKAQDAAKEDQNKLIEAEKKLVLIEQQLIHTTQQMQDWEKTKEDSLKVAKAAMFESGTEVFKKEAKQLNEHFAKVTESVSTLHSQVTKHENKVDTVWKSLSTPHAVGQFSEIGLENTLKNYGLEPGVDFILQANIDGEAGNLRPDALVFLPGGNLLVIDSKSSKFFLELAATKNQSEEATIAEKLRKRMEDHLKSLASKGYKDAVAASYKQQKGKEKIRDVLTVMFMQSDAHIEQLYRIDSSFRQKCEKHQIIPSGPTGLAGLLSFARFEILRSKQESNYEVIVTELSGLLGSIETVLGYALKVGKGIEGAANNYQKFVNSINANFLPKSRRMEKLGVSLPKNKQIPNNLPSYHVSSDASTLVEGEAEEIEEPAEVRKLEEVS